MSPDQTHPEGDVDDDSLPPLHSDEEDVDPDFIEYGMILTEDNFDEEFRPRLKNEGLRQHRRFTGYDQNLPMVVYGYRKATVHGIGRESKTNNEVPMTIVVFQWKLQQRKPGHRFKSATLRAIFSTRRKSGEGDIDSDDEDDTADDEEYEGEYRRKGDSGIDDPKLLDHYYDPHVAEVSPNGTFSLESTVTDVQVTGTRTVEGTAGVGAGAGPATVEGSGTVRYELSKSVTATDRVRIEGAERSEGKFVSVDRCNVAEWKLYENESTKSGLPSTFCTAVRLERRRRDRHEFTVRFEIESNVDSATNSQVALKKFLGLVPRDDPIIFNPIIKEGEEVGEGETGKRGRGKQKRKGKKQEKAKDSLVKWKNQLHKKELFDECKMVMYKSMPSRE